MKRTPSKWEKEGIWLPAKFSLDLPAECAVTVTKKEDGRIILAVDCEPKSQPEGEPRT